VAAAPDTNKARDSLEAMLDRGGHGAVSADARRYLAPYIVLAVGIAEDGVARAAAGLR
jgi:hypothetical protein